MTPNYDRSQPENPKPTPHEEHLGQSQGQGAKGKPNAGQSDQEPPHIQPHSRAGVNGPTPHNLPVTRTEFRRHFGTQLAILRQRFLAQPLTLLDAPALAKEV